MLPSATRDIVVIGASAGGLKPLNELVAALPIGFPAAIFIVMHIGKQPAARGPEPP